MARIVNLVLEDTVFYPVIFAKYFDSSHSAAVKAVLTNMVKPTTMDAATGSDLISGIIINADDEHQVCNSGEGAVGAYVWQTFSVANPGKMTSNAEMVFCTSPLDVFGAYPDLKWSPRDTCAKLDAWVSSKMTTLGGYVLVHELA